MGLCGCCCLVLVELLGSLVFACFVFRFFLLKYADVYWLLEFGFDGFILVGYAQTAAVGSVLMIGNTVYTELSGRSGRLRFDHKVCLFAGCRLALRC